MVNVLDGVIVLPIERGSRSLEVPLLKVIQYLDVLPNELQLPLSPTRNDTFFISIIAVIFNTKSVFYDYDEMM